jgi:uncharacterized protein (TIGR02118 family)
MPGAKIVVLYPMPRDVEAFERAYIDDHTPMVTPNAFPRLTKFVATEVIATPSGEPPPFHRVAELHFPSVQALQSAVASASAQKAVAHAFAISTGGPPVVLIAEEKTTIF